MDKSREPSKFSVQYLTLQGEVKEKTLNGFPARIVQHEVDQSERDLIHRAFRIGNRVNLKNMNETQLVIKNSGKVI